jgi:hypothetical protein
MAYSGQMFSGARSAHCHLERSPVVLVAKEGRRFGSPRMDRAKVTG